jgi:hypothetical protein
VKATSSSPIRRARRSRNTARRPTPKASTSYRGGRPTSTPPRWLPTPKATSGSSTSRKKPSTKKPSDSAPVKRFGTAGTGPGQLTEPYGIAIKPSGNIFIGERGNNRVEEFSPSGEYLAQFGTKGSGPGQFSELSNVAVGQGGVLFVADSNNMRVQRWSFE